MYHYIVQFRQVRVATTQINSTIKQISFCHVSHLSHLKICHQHKLATLFITLIKHLIHFSDKVFQVLVPESPNET